MKYRINKRTGDRISEIGIGSSYMFGAGMVEAVRALRRAVEGGINYFNLAAGDGTTFPIYGEALHNVRKNLFFQIHFGADYSKGTYGNHCKPCPVGIDVGLVNKYYDLARAGDSMAAEHYRTLEKNAADCIRCGHCDSRCPFGVRQSERMREIAAYFQSAE